MSTTKHREERDHSPALARLVRDADAFATSVWAQHPLLVARRDDFSDLLDVNACDEVLSSVARRPTFRLVQDGRTLPPADYTKTVRLGGRDIEDVADVRKISDGVAAGATLVLQGLERTWTPLRDFCRRLEGELSHPVQANAYLSPPAATGLSPHVDLHDVFVVQVAGCKVWSIEGLGDVVLNTGDVAYLPAGTRHAAASRDRTSLHITIGILRVTYRQVLKRMLDDPTIDLDDPLPIGFLDGGRGDGVAVELRARLDEVARRIADTNPTTVLDGERRRAERRMSGGGGGRLADTVMRLDVDDDTLLRRTQEVAVRMDGPSVIVEAGTVTLTMPAAAASAMAMVAANQCFAVADLAGLDRQSRIVLARRLLRERFVTLG